MCNSRHFCTNGGTCDPKGELKCTCPEGWKGDKCQFSVVEEDVSYASGMGGQGSSSKRKGTVTGIIIGTVLVGGMMVFLVTRSRRKSGIDPSYPAGSSVSVAGPPPEAFIEPSEVLSPNDDGSDVQDVTLDAPSELESSSTVVPVGEII